MAGQDSPSLRTLDCVRSTLRKLQKSQARDFINLLQRLGESATRSRPQQPVRQKCQRVNHSSAVLLVATDGRDVVFARNVMATEEIAAGRLIRLIPKVTLASQLARYVVYRAENSSPPKIAAFREG